MVRWGLWLSLILVLFFHVWQLSSVPRGLYVDESSIGLNAASIARSGVDEHGIAWPTYFKAFNEFKNPLYIYAAAGIFKLFGVSEFTLRFTSFGFFALFLGGWLVLIRLLFKKNVWLQLYAVLSAGFLPWFFNLSRIAFEVISQLAVVTLAVALTKATYDNSNHPHQIRIRHFLQTWVLPLSTGVMIGLSFYSYSTARLLSGLFLITLFVVYRSRRYWWSHLKVAAACGLMLLPYLQFSQEHPGALTYRFHQVTYWLTYLPLNLKLWLFTKNYLQFFSPQYLLYRGDTILRHHPGPAGSLFVVVTILAVLGVIFLWRHARHQRFHQFILVSLFLSPVAAALTTGDSSLRTILLGLFLLLASCYGFISLQRISDAVIKRSVLSSLIIILVFEIVTYLYNYFAIFPEKSIWANESYNVRGSLMTGLRESTSDVIASQNGNEQYAHIKFYLLTLGLSETEVSVVKPIARDGRCVIVSAFDERVFEEEYYSVEVYAQPGDFTKVKCFRVMNY